MELTPYKLCSYSKDLLMSAHNWFVCRDNNHCLCTIHANYPIQKTDMEFKEFKISVIFQELSDKTWDWKSQECSQEFVNKPLRHHCILYKYFNSPRGLKSAQWNQIIWSYNLYYIINYCGGCENISIYYSTHLP